MPKVKSGAVSFVGVFFLVAALFNLMVGLVAVFVDGNVSEAALPVVHSLTAWGIVLCVIAGLEAYAGVGILNRRAGTQVLGIAIAALGAFFHLAFKEGDGGWGFTLLVIDLIIIYVLTTHGNEFK
jgi:hypothetical protein